jgi:hypothetical protein
MVKRGHQNDENFDAKLSRIQELNVMEFFTLKHTASKYRLNNKKLEWKETHDGICKNLRT